MTLDEAKALDRADPLSPFLAEFDRRDGRVYLDGNSLGVPPRATAGRIAEVIDREWAGSLIGGWNDHDWIGAPARIGATIAGIIGAREDEVVVTDSTSVNLFKLTVAAARAATERAGIVAEAGNFPTDLHVARTAAELTGKRLVVAEPDGMAAAIGPDTAVAVLAHVHYKTGARYDMAALTAHAEAQGAPILWDLSHSVGAVPLDLTRDRVPMAVGCGYKYLNGGPGAPAFLHVAREWQARLTSPISGWFGHADPFAFGDDWQAAPGVERFLAGTPPVLSMAALEVGVDLMARVDPVALWSKAVALWELFVARVGELAPELELITPREADARGSHASFRHTHAHEIVAALIERGVVGDFRAPDVARFGITPLTLTHEEVWRAAGRGGRGGAQRGVAGAEIRGAGTGDVAIPPRACSGGTPHPRRPNQMTCRGPLPFGRARTATSSTANPASFRRPVKRVSGAADHTASTPPGLSAAFATARPRAE